jgi:hypothetical protein
MPKSRHTEIIACSMPKAMLALIDEHASLDRHGGNRSAAMRELVLIGLREIRKAKRRGREVKPVVINFKTGYITLAPHEHIGVPDMEDATPEEIREEWMSGSERNRRNHLRRMNAKGELYRVIPPVTDKEREEWL